MKTSLKSIAKADAARKKKKIVQKTMQKVSEQSVDSIGPDNENLALVKRVSAVWDFATRSEDPDYAICSLCPGNKLISTNNGSTSTLREHLISKHGKKELITGQKRKKKSESMSATRREELHKLLIDCVIRDGRPFRDFEKPGMKEVLKEAFPSKRHFLSRCWDQASQRSVENTLDHWTSMIDSTTSK